MSFSNQNSLVGTVRQLKEIVSSLESDNEALKLVQQMEVLAAEIERKSSKHNSNVIVSTPISPIPV